MNTISTAIFVQKMNKNSTSKTGQTEREDNSIMRTESEMNARVAKAIKEVEQKKAALAEAKKKASAEKRRRENHHKYMMGGCVAKYFPECYLCNEEELNMVIKAGLESIQCQNVIKSLKEQSDASMAGAKTEEVKSLYGGERSGTFEV